MGTAFTIPNEAEAAYGPQSSPDRTDIEALANALSDRGVLSGCEVAPLGAPEMAVSVSAGLVLVGGSTVEVAAVVSLPIDAPDTADRKDVVVVDDVGTVAVLRGTAAQAVDGVTPFNGRDPVKPTVGDGLLLLAEIYVAAATTSVTSANVTDKRCVVRLVRPERVTFLKAAARPLSAHRVVTPQPDESVDYADPSDIAEAEIADPTLAAVAPIRRPISKKGASSARTRKR